ARARVLIGANREEWRRRPTTSPVCCRIRSLRCLLAGADHGPEGSVPGVGTWLGGNEAKLAGAGHHPAAGRPPPGRPSGSKGLLAVELLGFEGPDAAVRFAVRELRGGGFGGCNYLIAGPNAGFLIQAPGASRVSAGPIAPGIHAMTNLDFDDAADPRIRL